MQALNKFLNKNNFCKLFIVKRKQNYHFKYIPEKVIIDMKSNPKKLIDSFRKKAIKIITIENFYKAKSDLNICIFNHNNKNLSKTKTGLKYAIIRQDLFNIKKKRENFILIFLGSRESKKKILFIIKFLNKIFRNVKLKFIFMTKYYKFFRKINFKKNYFFYYKNNFSYYFANCKFAIINGGLTAIESIYLKKPVFVLPQSKYEKYFVNFINKKNIFLGVNLKSLYIPSKNELILKTLKASHVIDGKGMNRIEKLIANV
jgi:spore coat polysaccharide biosynthesis predicted glycosyltransferase SpsG